MFNFCEQLENPPTENAANFLPGEPKKIPPYDFCWYYSNAWEFLYEILHDC